MTIKLSDIYPHSREPSLRATANPEKTGQMVNASSMVNGNEPVFSWLVMVVVLVIIRVLYEVQGKRTVA